ncbi:MGMT family protein [Arthrobacter bussei]|uniref:Cysteine methyltransferase n=1 Tax=Arthrobacter bussei TaxID=2594179 RepID=A0A7X1TMD5_9MICC|nr:MGMT family protein [Arthrobacter bussei]MPY09579.1 cysteine methyltransferase [Arthrobacter bussei]
MRPRADGPRQPPGPQEAAAGSRPAARADPAAYAGAVLDVTAMIPSGKVLTYGDIAELLACGGPRQVGRALSLATRDVPWWRVLRAGGRPAQGLAREARSRYDDEGTALAVPADPVGEDDYRVVLAEARWWPSPAQQDALARLGASLSRPAP